MLFCAYCLKTFSRKEHLERHVTRHRPSTSESDTGAGGLTSNQTTVAERTPISCINCASAKTRCDKRVPCSRCEEKGFLPCEARFATKANRKSIAPRIQYPQVVQATAGTPHSLTEPTVPADVAGDTGESKKIDIEREKHDAQLAVPSNIPIACINCANAKTYCDKRVPCTRCQGNGLPCEARFAKRRNRLFPSFKPNEGTDLTPKCSMCEGKSGLIGQAWSSFTPPLCDSCAFEPFIDQDLWMMPSGSSPLGPRVYGWISKCIADSLEPVPSLTEDYSRSSESCDLTLPLQDQDETKMFFGLHGLQNPDEVLLLTAEADSEEAQIKRELFSDEAEAIKQIDFMEENIYERPPLRRSPPAEEAWNRAVSHMSGIGSATSERESTDSESAWVSDYSGIVPFLDRDHPFMSIKSTVVQHGLLAYQNSQNQLHAGSQDTDVQGTPSVNQDDKVENTQGKRANGKSRKRDISEEKQDSGDDGSPPAKRPRASKRSPGAHNLFACPFVKKDPLKYRNCYSYVLKRIRDVKQQLSRFHQLPMYCPRCMAIFETEETRDGHIRVSSCVVQDTIIYEGVTRAQKTLLGQRASSKATPSDQWFAIFDILFPDLSPRPKSAYMNKELTAELEGFQDLMYAEGPRIIASAIRSSRIQTSTLEDAKGDELALLELAIQDGLQQIAQRWSTNISNALSYSGSSEATAAEGPSHPGLNYDDGRPEPSHSSSNTLAEDYSYKPINLEDSLRLVAENDGLEEINMDGQPTSPGFQKATKIWDDWNANANQHDNADLSDTVPSSTSNADQRHVGTDLNNDMENGGGLWEMLPLEFWDKYAQLPEG